jgi:polyphosphate kinase 2 (PPK2 family)
MLEKVDLTKQLPKKEYKAHHPYLASRLYDLQKACWDANIPSVILFEGWDAAGKGSSINLLTQRLDPRGRKLYAIRSPRTYETHMPWLWRFWLKLPNYGQMAIFDRSWYGRVLVERVAEVATACTSVAPWWRASSVNLRHTNAARWIASGCRRCSTNSPSPNRTISF